MPTQLENRPIIQRTGKGHENSSRRRARMKPSRGIRAQARTDEDIAHIERVKALPCGLTGAPGPSDAHHILEGRTPGRKVSDWLTIPLSREAHTGPHGIHGDRALWRIHKKTELECLADTLQALYG